MIIWAIAAQQTAGLNHQAEREYKVDLERWKQEYDAWQQSYVTTYRLPPPPVACKPDHGFILGIASGRL